MNAYLYFILAVLLFGYLLDLVATLLNLKALDPLLPAPFADVYDKSEYARSQAYTRARSSFALVQNTVTVALTIAFILAGGFNLVDTAARSLGQGPVLTGIVFTGVLLLLSGGLGLPFSLYSTFVLEQRYGMNRTTVRTFCLDLLRVIALTAVIGAPLLGFVLWFFEAGGTWAWLYCWLAVVLFIVVMQYLSPVLIMPLFNRFEPLAEGELKDAITAYVRSQRFTVRGIFTMDGSRRSTRLNAFFTGFGRFRRIVFFDTLLAKLEPGEIVAVLAHEMGHYRRRHIFKMMGASILQMGFMLFLLSLFLNNPGLFAAFGMEQVSVYGSLVFFGFLFSPLSLVLGIAFNWLSRQYEYEADEFAAGTTGSPAALISGLKKLSLANLSNLTPHPFNVVLHFSHPPVLQRIEALERYGNDPIDR